MKRKPIGEVLLQLGAVDQFQLHTALVHQRQWGTPLGQVLVEREFCTPEQLLIALAKQTGLPRIDLDQENMNPDLAALLPRKVAQQHRTIPLRAEGLRDEVLVVAMAAPAALTSMDAIQGVTGAKRLRVYVADDRALERAFRRIYLGDDGAAIEGLALPDEEADFVFEHLRVAAPVVLLYGWKPELAAALEKMLLGHGLNLRVGGPEDVFTARQEDVVVAPLPAMELLLEGRRRTSARLLVAGKTPDTDLARAQAIRAVGFVAAPLDAALLVRAIRRCQALGPPVSTAP